MHEKELKKMEAAGFEAKGTTLAREAKADPKDRIEVEIGDSKQPDFKPQVKIKRWDNEINFSLRAEEHPDATIEVADGVVKYITPTYEVHQYEKPEAGEDGGHEFEWVLNERPETNRLTATIQTKELDFFYQPELTPEDIQEGAERPENVVGSYAVYHATKGKMNDVAGKAYKTGKAFHIYRPKAVDANGEEAWCELGIDTEAGTLTVDVPEKFLDKAAYPVKVDPTFGYTSLGASGFATGAGNYLIGEIDNTGAGIWTAPEDGTITSVSHGFSTGSVNVRPVVYNNATGVLVGVGAEVSTTANQFNTMNCSGTIVSGTVYKIGSWIQSNTTTRYDTVATNILIAFDTSETYSSSADPGNFNHTGSTFNKEPSIYATYTATSSSLSASVNDAVSVTEGVTVVIAALVPAVADTVSVAETITMRANEQTAPAETVSITESVAIVVVTNITNLQNPTTAWGLKIKDF